MKDYSAWIFNFTKKGKPEIIARTDRQQPRSRKEDFDMIIETMFSFAVRDFSFSHLYAILFSDGDIGYTVEMITRHTGYEERIDADVFVNGRYYRTMNIAF